MNFLVILLASIILVLVIIILYQQIQYNELEVYYGYAMEMAKMKFEDSGKIVDMIKSQQFI